MGKKDYYRQRSDAIRYIRGLYGKGKSLVEIQYLIGSAFGFSQKFVEKEVELIDKMIDEGIKNKQELLKNGKKRDKNVL